MGIIDKLDRNTSYNVIIGIGVIVVIFIALRLASLF